MTPEAMLTLSVAILSTAGIVITAMIKFVPSRPGNEKPPEKNPDDMNGTKNIPALCTAHSGLVEAVNSVRSDIRRVEDNQKQLWEALDDIRRQLTNIPARVAEELTIRRGV